MTGVRMAGVVDWLGTLDWGTVPEWFASVGTVGALIISLVLIMAGRKHDRQAIADAFVTWGIPKDPTDQNGTTSYPFLVHAHNTGTAPIPFAIFIEHAAGENRVEPLQDEEKWPLEPQDSVVYATQLARDSEEIRLHVMFADARGRTWYRDLHTEKYVSKRAAMSTKKWRHHRLSRAQRVGRAFQRSWRKPKPPKPG